MKIEKIFSIRVYDGKKILKKGLTEFLQEVNRKSDWQTRLNWDTEKLINKLTRGTCLMLLLGDEVCGLVDYHVQPLSGRTFSIPRLHDTDTIWISDFIIRPGYYKLGLGRMLINVAFNYSCYLNKKQIRIFKSNYIKLNTFLEHYGFSPCKDAPLNRPVYQMDLSPKPSMPKQRRRNKRKAEGQAV